MEWRLVKRMFTGFSFQKQFDQADCGPACLKMICSFHGHQVSMNEIKNRTTTFKAGTSAGNLVEAAQNLGFDAVPIRINLSTLKDIPLPAILNVDGNHYVVLYQMSVKEDQIIRARIADPLAGKSRVNPEWIQQHWLNDTGKGIAIVLEPKPGHKFEMPQKSTPHYTLTKLLRFPLRYPKLLLHLISGLLLSIILQLIFPYLTKSVVDKGVADKNLPFIYLVLLAQVTLFISQTLLSFIRSWILLHMSIRLNISILSEFLLKLMKLPIAYYDSKTTGDLLQRIRDHDRVKNFFAVSSLNLAFSLLTYVAFTIVIGTYSKLIFSCIVIASGLYVGYIVIFLGKRKAIDYARFNEEAKSQSNVLQLINGMQDIKLHNFEDSKRFEWEKIQARLFTLTSRGLAVDQLQQAGAVFINEGKNILITFLSASAVVHGQMTLGTMLAIQYMVGQLNAPLDFLVRFFQSVQDAGLSLERLNEIHSKKNEEDFSGSSGVLASLQDIKIRNLTFRYPGQATDVLKNVSLNIPKGKVTAIVGMSGSGKTTLLKILMKFYEITPSTILVGEDDLNAISHHSWRAACGVVLQNSYLFSDSIASNIAMHPAIDQERLRYAAQIANIEEFIRSLPQQYDTKIGPEGIEMSQGQKQRMLIARAVYKDPKVLFLDEATNALDTTNERVIMNNLNRFFTGRTVIVVAHRLSTVQHADQIIVLDQGEISEIGSHQSLILNKDTYYHLIKNQLELNV